VPSTHNISGWGSGSCSPTLTAPVGSQPSAWAWNDANASTYYAGFQGTAYLLANTSHRTGHWATSGGFTFLLLWRSAVGAVPLLSFNFQGGETDIRSFYMTKTATENVYCGVQQGIAGPTYTSVNLGLAADQEWEVAACQYQYATGSLHGRTWGLSGPQFVAASLPLTAAMYDNTQDELMLGYVSGGRLDIAALRVYAAVLDLPAIEATAADMAAPLNLTGPPPSPPMLQCGGAIQIAALATDHLVSTQRSFCHPISCQYPPALQWRLPDAYCVWSPTLVTLYWYRGTEAVLRHSAIFQPSTAHGRWVIPSGKLA
jgi:hypothetical protein